MIRNRIYYHAKPFLPRPFRMWMRRVIAQRTRRKIDGTWPILPGSERIPDGWTGWPNGKQFAFVLSHDVEGPEGLARCRELAELELSYGFRSSFNFIPEGTYSVPDDLRAWLTDQGFEVGVHDLHHNGKLYQTRERFREKAERINRYLSKWGAVGFRSGFMHHNLDWLRDLSVLYDASTFDTDPFEPQPDGAGTIFPFWVSSKTTGGDCAPKDRLPGPDGGGYIELPYTLVQDSTLFLLLQEKTPAIWLQKVEWIARHGGMALLNTHPDYMNFGRDPVRGLFSAEIYGEFLREVASRHQSQYWHALPREAAEYCRNRVPARDPRPTRRVCMITYSPYEFDNRVRRYAESLALRGDQVDVLATSWEPAGLRETVHEGVSVTRLVPKAHLNKSTLAYLAHCTRFFLAAATALSMRVLKRNYDLIHVHNMPDFLVFAALLARCRGAKIILDLHDLVPELFVDKMVGWKARCANSLLKWEEQISARFAHHVIISNHLWLDDVTSRSARPDRCSVYINNIDSRVFYRRPRTRRDDARIILFHGSLSRHQGVDLVVRAMPAVLRRVPKAEFHVYGSGSERPAIEQLAVELGVASAVRLRAPVVLSDIPPIIANADVGVVAKRADSFGNRAYSTKILEFMSQGVPVVLSRTQIDQYYFDDSVARFFDSGDVSGLADALIEVLTDNARRESLIQNAFAYVPRNDWSNRQHEYLRLVDSLIDCRKVVPTGGLTVEKKSVEREETLANAKI